MSQPLDAVPTPIPTDADDDGSGRTNPPFVAGEREMLENWLEFHRATLVWKCAGLTGEQLATRSVPPSTLSLLGLVRHMSEVERSWFRRCMAGEDAPPIYYTADLPDDDLDDLDTDQAEDALATLEVEMRAAREIAARHDSLDAISLGQRHGQDVCLRWILVHMIEEYARHNGHADLLRETIDGVTGD